MNLKEQLALIQAFRSQQVKPMETKPKFKAAKAATASKSPTIVNFKDHAAAMYGRALAARQAIKQIAQRRHGGE